MSIRANSLRNVLVDSFSFTILMTLAAVGMTAVAQGAEPRIERLADQSVADRQADDHVDSRQNTDDNLPSGDPTESPEAKREAIMLGMTLFERSAGDIRVTDVAATSPAWDAGIRRGDRIHALDGLKPQRLATWIDDVGKILKDTEDGNSIAADIEREGEVLDLRIKVPVSKAAEVRDARQEEQAIARLRGGNQGQVPQGQPGGQPIGYATDDRNADYGPGYGGYGGYGLGGFFDDGGDASEDNGDDRMATSAVAQLMAVNTLNRGGMQSSGGQVGVAGFQNSGEGIDAMVAVQGLPQGNYRVGIGQANNMGVTPGFEGLDAAGDRGVGLSPALEGTADGSRNSNVGRNQTRGTNSQQTNDQQTPANNQRNQAVNPLQNQQQQQNQQQPGFVPAGGQTPIAPQGGAGGTAGAVDGASLANPPNAVLAQQLDTQQQAQGAAAQPTTQQRQSTTGTTSQRENVQRTPQANPYDPRDVAQSQRQQQNAGQPLNTAGGSPFVAEIGVLQVGPDGTGRVQNRLEGMAVRNLAGMSVIIESNNWQRTRGVQNDPRVTQGAQGTQAEQQRRRAGQQLGQSNEPMTRGAQGIVATGVIQLRDGGNTAGAAGQQAGLQQRQQPVDGATRQQQSQSQISNPREQFNPSR